ncbi:hypothetical protein GYMLUDRAFT_250751 [Collybiopsis luxurians FD-317 M1]|uniref:Unplaced genomic scaffold GYMLUscaffold_86, whole genome shotgun sequence n=1 Tax=Collybiopsis luxurians FD-317 M1 TaxID=944289 RepID=A0A0D0BEM8_9AGAR|nr:hypothetical protein GYMLUDRAFT_250751 [Collybiopsis luxurians FD-317 M1]
MALESGRPKRHTEMNLDDENTLRQCRIQRSRSSECVNDSRSSFRRGRGGGYGSEDVTGKDLEGVDGRIDGNFDKDLGGRDLLSIPVLKSASILRTRERYRTVRIATSTTSGVHETDAAVFSLLPNSVVSPSSYLPPPSRIRVASRRYRHAEPLYACHKHND